MRYESLLRKFKSMSPVGCPTDLIVHVSDISPQNAAVQVKNTELNETKHELQSQVKTLQSEVRFVQYDFCFILVSLNIL